MMPNSGKTSAFHAKKGRKAHLGRLKSKQPMLVTSKDELGSSECCGSAGTGETGGCSSEEKSEDLRFGHISMMGRRRVMEDAVSVAPPRKVGEEYAFFAVYDGHGGSRAAEICSERMHKYLDRHVEKAKKSPKEKSLNWEKVMEGCFRSMDEVVGKDKKGDDEVMEGASTVSETIVGSTALVVLVGPEVVVANCGDSRAVICSGGVAVPLSSDHKPDRPDEKERVEAAGGNIINWNDWRVEGVLATSRCLGTFMASFFWQTNLLLKI
ncbi:probable phosphatase 2C 8 [Olea europaea subsp. europaea]|uniref:protein-serine/threonine phosphatase n=1 Tax=Olea europaea subsp. europaea TaxID=158383 RepID=A0A8S0SZZ4_OLEEU|nr:probable phosphatase 2C 8 [Olea europaea subsp. europaea]